MKKPKRPFEGHNANVRRLKALEASLRLPKGACFTINGKRVPDTYQVKTGEVLVIQWPVEHGTAHVAFKGKPLKSKK